jgi:hypothetical protein
MGAWKEITRAVRRLFRPPVGIPLGVNLPADPAEHAEVFSHRSAEDLDWQACLRMEALGISKGRIGANDRLHGIEGRAFNPYERDGGGFNAAGQLNVDSGALNPDLMSKNCRRKVSKVWAKLASRHRQDALIAHEDAEWKTGSHEAALEAAPRTDLPISDESRAFLREMKKGRRGR